MTAFADAAVGCDNGEIRYQPVVADPLMERMIVTALRIAPRIAGGHLAQMAHSPSDLHSLIA